MTARSTPAPPVRRRWGATLGLGLGGLLAAAILLEGGARLLEAVGTHRAGTPADTGPTAALMLSQLRLRAPGLVEADPELGFRLRPNAVTSGYTINAAGYRGSLVETAKPPGTYRVLALGGSTTFGWGVAEADTYPRRLEVLLMRACTPRLGTRIDVLNGGVPGQTSVQNLRSLETQWLAYSPDLVLVMAGLNDALAAGLTGLRAMFRNDAPVMTPMAARLLDFHEIATRHSAFARWYARQLARWVPAATFLQGDAGRSAGSRVLAALDGTSRLARAHGFGLAVVGNPGLQDGVGGLVPGAFRAPFAAAVAPELAVVATQQQEWSRAHDAPYVDVAAAFARQPQADLYLDDGMHFTPAGNGVIAEAVYERVFRVRCEG
jgi:lysophospholipase L1-like esterase